MACFEVNRIYLALKNPFELPTVYASAAETYLEEFLCLAGTGPPGLLHQDWLSRPVQVVQEGRPRGSHSAPICRIALSMLPPAFDATC